MVDDLRFLPILRHAGAQISYSTASFSLLLRNLWRFALRWAVLTPFQHLHKQPSKVDFPIKNLRNIECIVNEMKNGSSLGSCGADARPCGLSILEIKKGKMNALFVFNKSKRVCFITLRPSGA